MDASVKPLPRLKKRQLSSKQKLLPKTLLGAWGESQACEYLLSHGFQILTRNCRWRLHEVDVVAFDCAANELVFVEVKTRSSLEYGEPALAVGQKKLASLIKAAKAYMRENPRFKSFDYRFDIVSVFWQLGGSAQINHYPNITWEMVK